MYSELHIIVWHEYRMVNFDKLQPVTTDQVKRLNVHQNSLAKIFNREQRRILNI